MSSSRPPLAPLPLSRFVPASALIASPVSLPVKRSAPTPSTSDKERDERGKKVRGMTPQVRAALERDELGVGRSPARKLFGDEAGASGSPGVSGSVTSSRPPPPSRSLAPSPPIADSPARAPSSTPSNDPFFPLSPVPLTSIGINGVELSLHDIGFTIFPDLATSFSIGIGTPKSRRAPAPISIAMSTDSTSTSASTLPLSLGSDVFSSPPSSPSTSSSISSFSNRLEDKENHPPPSHSTQSTPSKYLSTHSARSTPKSGSSSWFDEDETFVAAALASSPGGCGPGGRSPGGYGSGRSPGGCSGSGRRRLGTGKSKLAQVVAGDVEGDGGEEDELTPGRLARDSKGKGKERMVLEADDA